MNVETGWLGGHALAPIVGGLLMLSLGAVIGAGNGLAVAKLRMPSFMVTLTTMMFLSGLAIWLTQSKNIPGLPKAFTRIGSQLWITVLIATLIAGFTSLILGRTLFGRWLYGVGQNSKTANVSGVPVDGVIITAYATSGLFAAAASIIYTARLETGSPVLGQRILLDVIGASVL